MAWLAGYTTRKMLTTDNTKIDSTLTNFPMMVKFTDTNFDFTKAHATGSDLRFTSDDGSSLLYYEREMHSNTGSIGIYWVNVPSVSSSAATSIFAYYNSAITTDGAVPTSVWNTNHMAVWHLTGSQDSTTNAKHLTNVGATNVVANMGSGYSFATDDYMGFENISNPSGTISFWFKLVNYNNNPMIAEGVTNAEYPYLYITTGIFGSVIWISNKPDSGTVNAYMGNTNLTLNTWHHGVVNSTGSNWNIFINGGSETLSAIAGANTGGWFNTISGSPALGALRRDPNIFGNATLDEVKLYSDIKPHAYIRALYNSENNTLLTFGSEEVTGTAFSQWLNEIVAFAESRRYVGSVWKTEVIILADTILKAVTTTRGETLTITDDIITALGELFYLYLTDNISFTLLEGLSNILTENISISKDIVKTISSIKSQNFIISDGRFVYGTYNIVDTLTISDSIESLLTHLFSKTLADTLNIAENIKEFSVSIRKLDTISLTDSIKKDGTHSLADILAITDNILKSIGKNVSETLTLQDNIRKLTTLMKSESITLSESETNVITKILELAETLTLLESMATELSIQRILTENIQLSDAYRRIVNLGNLLVNTFTKIITDDISDHFDVNRIITDDISGKFGSEFG